MLKLLLCRNQFAGTDEILRRVADDVKAERPRRILMVPELISHDIERRLCMTAGDTASRFAQVLTFTRLADRVAEAAGTGAVSCMDQGGRIVAMASTARNLHSKLKFYASVESKPELLAQLLDVIDEFKCCCVTVADLHRAAEEIGQTNSLFAQKLSELALLLEAYEATCAQGKRDPRDLMHWVLEQMQECTFGENMVFFVDGFPDFTRQHMDILEHLIRTAADVTVCLNCDSVGSASMAFEKAGKTARELIALAQAAQTPYNIEFCREEKIAFSSVLGSLFQGAIRQLTAEEASLQLIRCDAPYDECRVAAQKVRELVSSGARYRDIAVVCSDVTAYKAPLRMIFNKCGIPLYLAGTEEVLRSGVMSTVLHALDAVLDGMEQRDVLRYLRSALSPISLQECDMLENYVHIWGISGKRWQENWKGHPEGLSGKNNPYFDNLLSTINDIRKRAIDPLTRLQKLMCDGKNLAEKIAALYDFLEQIGFAENLQKLADQLEQEQDFRGAQICGQLWEILVGALEQLYDVLGSADWNHEYICRLIRLLLSQYDVGTIPPVLDAVTMGDVAAMRCQRERHLIFLGANEGQLPSYCVGAGIFTEQERSRLRSMDLRLSRGNFDGLQSQFAEIYGVFCGATNSITVTCSDEPSFVYRRLLQMSAYPEQDAREYLTGIENEVDAAAQLVLTGRKETARRLQLDHLYEQIRSGKEFVIDTVSRENIEKLYGQQLALSASQVDRQAECRLSYFLQYGLRAKELREAKVDPAEFGTYVHSVLENTARDVMRLGGFRQVDLDTTLSIADSYSKAYAREHFSDLDSQRMDYLLQRNMRELELVVAELWREMHESHYDPVRFELNFARDGEMPAIEIDGANMPAQLRGFVDRVDLWQHAGASYVRVVDYKTGKKDFYYCDVFNGVGLQMLLYLFALEEGGEAVTGSMAIPAGVQYFPARVPYVTASSSNDPQWIKDRQKQWIRKGLLLHDEASLAAMDPSENMEYLNCKRGKDGTLCGDLADRSQMIQLKRYVMQVLKRIVNEIESGNVQPNPYTRGSSHDACTFCPYGAVCHKSTVEGRRNYKAMTAERFWQEIGKELSTDG
jgi:ATP-dependent helicase/nuclease subunit B